VTKRKGPFTVEEVIERANKDPAYVERRRQAEELRATRIAKLRAEQAILVRELRQSGVKLNDLWDLVNEPIAYSGEALAILARHLQLPYSEGTRETIARALAVKEASRYWPILAAEYAREPDRGNVGPKIGLALALGATTTEATIEGLISFAMDPSNGMSRYSLLKALRKSKSPAAKEAIEKLRHDPQLAPHFDSWLRRR
jgi:hypothetical protein